MSESFRFWLPTFFLLVAAAPLWADDDKKEEEEKAEPPRAAVSNRVPDYLGRLQRVNEGFLQIHQEFTRGETRITETSQKLQQAQATVVQITQSAAVATQQLAAARDQAAAMTAQANAAAANPRNGARPQQNAGNVAQFNQLQIAIANLTNQLLRLEASLNQERQRIATLETDLNRNIQQRERTRLQGNKQLDEFWRLADPWGRFSHSELQTIIDELDRLLVTTPDNFGLLFVRGIAHRRLENFDAADADLSRLVDVEGNLQAVALAARGELRIAFGRDREGKADVGRATTLTKRKPDPRVMLYRGWLLCGQEKYQLAETEFVKALRLGTVDADAHRFLALLDSTKPAQTVSEKEQSEAINNAKRACDLTKSEDWLSFEALAAARAASGKFDEAVEAARQAVNLATGENRELCQQHADLYQSKQPLRIDWTRHTKFAKK